MARRWVLHDDCSFLQVRYNAIRRQTAAKVGEKELQVLDYQNTSATLLPLVAVAYALIFMVGWRTLLEHVLKLLLFNYCRSVCETSLSAMNMELTAGEVSHEDVQAI